MTKPSILIQIINNNINLHAVNNVNIKNYLHYKYPISY